MTHTSSSAILGKWRRVETRVDLDDPKSVFKHDGARGEIIEFTADGRMREPGTRESRSKYFGPVMYRLNAKRNPPHVNTYYASGEELQKGIYRIEGDRLIICWTSADFGGPRPAKFGGFTKGEADRHRLVAIYERMTKGTPKKAEAAKPAGKPPAARLLETQRLEAYLRKSSQKPPRHLGAGREAEWIPVAELEVVSGSLWAGDPLCMNVEDGCLVKLPAGTYVLAAQGMDFEGFRIVGRVRVYPKALRADRLQAGRAIGEAGTDSAAITVCDLRALLPVIAGQEYPFQRELEKQLRGQCGLLTNKIVPGVALPFVQSGFGDGTGPVLALTAAGKRVGIELSFLGENEEPKPKDSAPAPQKLSLLGEDTAGFMTRRTADGEEVSFWIGGEVKAGARFSLWSSASRGPVAYRIRRQSGSLLKDWSPMRRTPGVDAALCALETLKSGKYEFDFRIGQAVFSGLRVNIP